MVEQAPEEVPVTKLKYKMLNKLDKGGHGECFHVIAKPTNDEYVIKRVNMQGMDEDGRRRARKEASILEALNHPNIIRFTDVYKDR